MHRATIFLLGLLCLCGCESPGGNSLAAFGPNTIPPAARQPGSDPYYSAASAPPSANSAVASNSNGAPAASPQQPAANETPPAVTFGTTNGSSTALSSTSTASEPPVRIIEREGSLPATNRQPAETSRLPATSVPATPSPLQRTSVTPNLQPIPSSAFGKKSNSRAVAPASYEQPLRGTQAAESIQEWRSR